MSQRVLNSSSTIPLTDVKTKLNAHIDLMNGQGWELLSVVQQTVGIYEFLVMFWKKIVES